MADVLIVCAHCGHECKVSQYASEGTLICPSCGQEFDFPANGPGTTVKTERLSLREISAENLNGLPDEEDPGPGIGGPTPLVMDNVHTQRQRIHDPVPLWGWLAFVIMGGALVGLQYGINDYANFDTYYHWGRVGLAGLVSLLVLVAAFRESSAQGILCLLFFPYAIYYVFVRSDSYVLRGMTAALLLSIGAEIHFLGNEALLVTLQDATNRMIDGGDTLIDRASAKPVF